jgi:hypothetical protein
LEDLTGSEIVSSKLNSSFPKNGSDFSEDLHSIEGTELTMNKKLIAKALQARSRRSVHSGSRTRNICSGVLLAALASLPSFAGETNLLLNGDFEEPALPCGLWVAIPEGSGFITGWNVNVASTNNDTGGCDNFPYYSHSVDMLFCASGLYYAHTGHQGIDMAGTYSTPGDSIYQDVPTKPGRTYILTFYTSSNVDPIANGLTIEWDEVPIDTISTPIQGLWTMHSYSVQATSDLSRLRFVGNVGGGRGSFLDTVSLVGQSDDEPPVVSCPPSVTVPSGNVPPAATNVADFTAQGGSISDNQDPNPSILSSDEISGSCPVLVTRTYTVTDASGNATQCQQLITVQSQFVDDGIVWYPPVARLDKVLDTTGSKCVFKHGCTIPIRIRVRGCDGTDLTRNDNIIGTLEVLALSDCNDPSTAHPVPIEHNGLGGDGGLMVKAGGFLRYNLNTRKLPADTHCYLLKATVIDVATGESLSETLPIRFR